MKQLSTHVFNDKYRQGSTYTNPHLMLSVASGEWSTFVTNFGQVSLLNALNQCITGIGGVTLQQAYNDSGGAASVNVNNGDVSWNSVGAFSFNIDLSGTTGVADGFQVTNGADFLSLLRTAANKIAWTSEFETYDLNVAAAITLDSATSTIALHGYTSSTITGGAVASAPLYLYSTSDATKGRTEFDIGAFDALGNWELNKTAGVSEKLRIGDWAPVFSLIPDPMIYCGSNVIGGSTYPVDPTKPCVFWALETNYYWAAFADTVGEFYVSMATQALGERRPFYMGFSNKDLNLHSACDFLVSPTVNGHFGVLNSSTSANIMFLSSAKATLQATHVGLQCANPDASVVSEAAAADPTTTGSTATAIHRFHASSNVRGLDVGFSNTIGAWIQAQDTGNFANHFPISLNPNGGSVIINDRTHTPASALDVYGAISLSGIQMLNYSSANANSLIVGNGGASLTNDYSTIVGMYAGGAVTSGTVTAVGYNAAGGGNVTGGCTAVGRQAGRLCTSGFVSAFGYGALENSTTGENAAFGDFALGGITTTGENAALGQNAGRWITGGAVNVTTAARSTFLGYATKALADGGTNETVIGYSATGIGSNTVTLGNSSVVQTLLRGNFGTATTFGTSAVGVLGISSGTKPTTSPVDMAQMWVADRGATAGKAGHHLRSEDGTSHVFSDKVGFGTVTPDGSAFVQMDSTAGGLLPPRMTTAQRVAIAAPADGLVVYDITLHAFCVFENATWMTLSAGVDTNIGKVAIFEDRRYPQANGGSATASKWHPRTLNFTRYNGMASRVSLQSFPIVAVDTVNHYFYVSGDQTAHLPTGRRFAVRGSTGNDLEGAAAVHDAYLCSAVSYDGGANQTRVTVAAIASNTADGSIYTGKIVFQPGTYLVEAQTTASASAAANFHGLLRLAVPTGFTYTSGYVNAEGATFTEVSPPDYAYDRKQLSLVLNEVLVISSVDTLYELQQYQDQTLADVGLGSRSNVGGAGFYEHYAPIKIKCLS